LGSSNGRKKISQTLLADIEAKSKSLNFALSNEVLAQAIRISQKQKVLAALQSLSLKKPLEYYEDGKYLINANRWLDAKTNFLMYRNFVEQKTPVTKTAGDGGIRAPSQDSHLKYLTHIQDQLNAQGDKEEPNPILSTVPAHATNQYKRQWEMWKEKNKVQG